MKITFEPLTLRRWDDFTDLFGEHGACGGCWCMLWRLKRKEFELQKGDGNKSAMKDIVASGEIPGILAYHNSKAIGWCAVAPRSVYSALSRSRILKPVDNRECWSIACLYIKKPYRKNKISIQLIKAASNYVKAQGGKLVEGYPTDPVSGKDIPPAFAWTGISNAFIEAGFVEVARRSPKRPIMRLEINNR